MKQNLTREQKKQKATIVRGISLRGLIKLSVRSLLLKGWKKPKTDLTRKSPNLQNSKPTEYLEERQGDTLNQRQPKKKPLTASQHTSLFQKMAGL